MDIDIDIVYIDINKVLEQEAKLNELIIVFLSLYSQGTSVSIIISFQLWLVNKELTTKIEVVIQVQQTYHN